MPTFDVLDEITTRLPDEMTAWMEAVTGGTVVQVERRPGGGRKEAWFVDVKTADGASHEMFLRYDRTDPAAGDPWTLHREAIVYQALQGTEVPVPAVLGVHPHVQAMLSVRVAGESRFSQITDEREQVRTAQDFVRCLAALHRIDVAALDLTGFPAPTTVVDLVNHELDEWDWILEARGGAVDPALRFAMGWLRRNVPRYDGPIVLVQGDTGPGNFMYDDGKVVAVVDWELAHLGDPMDDIAWLSLRAAQEPFTSLPDRIAEYERLSGHAVDESRVAYYRVLAETKLRVMYHRAGGTRERLTAIDESPPDIGNALIYEMLHRRLWFEALGPLVGIELPAPDLSAEPAAGEHDWLYDALLVQLRDVVLPRVADSLAAQRAKGLARVIKYHAQLDRYGRASDEAELDDLAALLGGRSRSPSEGRALLATAVAAGHVSDHDHLRYQWRRIARDNELLRPSSGALADRHWPAIR